MSNHLDEYISINSPLNESMSILLKRGVFLLSLSGPGEIDSCKRISFLWWISWGKVFCSLPTMESISPCPTNYATFQGKTCTFWSFISCQKRKNCLIISLKETVSRDFLPFFFFLKDSTWASTKKKIASI